MSLFFSFFFFNLEINFQFPQTHNLFCLSVHLSAHSKYYNILSSSAVIIHKFTNLASETFTMNRTSEWTGHVVQIWIWYTLWHMHILYIHITERSELSSIFMWMHICYIFMFKLWIYIYIIYIHVQAANEPWLCFTFQL